MSSETAASPALRRTPRIGWVGWILILTGIRLIVAALIHLGIDETYYLAWARYPAWGYYDHPPMVAYWIALGTAIFGDSSFGVRVIFVLSTIPTTLAVYFAARALFDRATAEQGALWLNATLLVGVGCISATPDAPAVMFWALATCAFVYVATTGQGWWWLLVGLFAGLGAISKLTDLFLGLGILLCVLAVRDMRRWLRSPWFWAGGAVAALVMLPMLLWNAGHDWVTFASQFRRIPPRAFNPLRLPELFAIQFGLLNPPMAMFVGLGIYAWIARRMDFPLRALGILMWTLVPLIAYMSAHAIHSQVQGHWVAPIYPTLALVAAGAAAVAPGERWQRLRPIVFPIGVVASLVGLLLAANPGGRLLPPKADPGGINHGWEALAEEANRAREEAGAAWIATTRYFAYSRLVYSLRDRAVPVVHVAERVRYAFEPPPPGALLTEPALLLARESEVERFTHCFSEVAPLGTLDRKNGDSFIEAFLIFRVSGGPPDLFTDGCPLN